MLNTSNTLKLAAGLLFTASLAPLAAAGNYGGQPHAPELLPPNPTPGVCYARVEIPAEYTTFTEDVLVEEGYTTVEVSNPQLATRQEKVLVKEASVRYEVKQPRFKTVSEKVMTRPAYDKLTVTPPRFSQVTETVAASAPRLIWKKGNPGALVRQGYKIHSTADSGHNGQGYSSTVQYGQSGGATHCGATCEIWCLVEEPGETVQFRRKVVANPAQVQRRSVPARFQTIMKQVIADPGGVREVPVEARYQTIMVEDIVQPGGERQVTVPPKYGKINKKQLVSAERYEWRQVVCKNGTLPPVGQHLSSNATLVTPSHITTVQPSYSAPVSSFSSEPVAPTVNEMLANGARLGCVDNSCGNTQGNFTSGQTFNGNTHGNLTSSQTFNGNTLGNVTSGQTPISTPTYNLPKEEFIINQYESGRGF